MRCFLIVTFVCVYPVAAQDRKPDPVFFGKWKVVEMIYKGKKQDFGQSSAGTIEFKDGMMLIKQDEDRPEMELRIKLPMGGKANEFDIMFPGRSDISKGIFEMDKNSLTIAYGNIGKERPKSFGMEDIKSSIFYKLRRDK